MMEDTKSAVRKQFGLNAEGYVHSAIHAKGEDLGKLVAIAKLDSAMHVLDVATGGGHVANSLAPYVGKVTAFDLTPEILNAAKNFIQGNGNTNVEFVQGDAEAMPMAAQSYDLVTCRIAPHHFPNVKQFVSEVFRVLKPDGEFLLIDNVAPEDDEADSYYNEIEKRRDYSHYRAWKKSEWYKMLEAAGFRITETHGFNKKFMFDSWCNRMQVPLQEKEEIERYILSAPARVQERLNVVVKDGKVESFQGESILIKAVKWMNIAKLH